MLTHLDGVLAAKVLKCGTIKHPPLSDFVRGAGGWTFGGFYVELARVACAQAGLEPEFCPVDWSDLPSALTTPGQGLDLVLSVFETRQRLQYADFTAPFHRIGVGAVGLASSRKVTTVGDLQRDDVRIVVTKGEIGWECAVYDLKIPKYRLIVIENANLPEIVDYVRNGRADVAIFDDVTCDSCVSDDPELTHLFAHDSLYLCRNSIMIPKRDEAFGLWVEKTFLQARADPAIAVMEDAVLASAHGMIRKFR